MSDYERNPQAIESTNTANPYEPLSETKVGDTELLEGDSPAPGVCRVVMLPPEAVEKDKELDRKTTERAAQVHAGAAEIAAESASPFKTDVPSPTDSEAMSHPMETANMVLNTAGTAVSESLSAAQDSASATLASAKDAASSTLASAKDSTASTLTSAKDTASSTLASAQKTTSSALASAQDTATMALASAQQTAASAASTVQDTAASALASVHHAGQTTLHKAQDLGSATATVASRSMHATQDTATQLAATTADHVRRVSASLASTASEMLHSAEETAAKVAVQVLETVEHSIEMLRDQYVGSAQVGAHEQLDKDLQQRAEAEQQGKMTSVKDELAHVADMVVASAEDMLRKASEGSASTLGRDPNVQVEGTPGTVDQPESDMASVLTAESSEVDEQAPVEGFQEHEEFVIREGLPANKGSERAARKIMRTMEKESTQEMMEEDDAASMTA